MMRKVIDTPMITAATTGALPAAKEPARILDRPRRCSPSLVPFRDEGLRPRGQRKSHTSVAKSTWVNIPCPTLAGCAAQDKSQNVPRPHLAPLQTRLSLPPRGAAGRRNEDGAGRATRLSGTWLSLSKWNDNFYCYFYYYCSR